VRRSRREPDGSRSRESAPSITGCGIDTVELARVGAWLERYDPPTLELVFSRGELERTRGSCRPDRALAVCFAAKEAVSKALGTGFTAMSWPEVDTTVTSRRMTVTLSGDADRLARRIGIQAWHLSWACDGRLVTVIAFAEAARGDLAKCIKRDKMTA
jgi:holo-[acyl-carrier protein] synthase